MKPYRYDLMGDVEIDVIQEQESKLLAEGFVKNPVSGTLDKYREVFDDVVKVDLEYEEERETVSNTSEYLASRRYVVEYSERVSRPVPVHRYLSRDEVRVTYDVSVPETVPTFRYEVTYPEDELYDVSYAEPDDGGTVSRIFGFFRRVLGIRKKERRVSAARVGALKKSAAAGRVEDLTVTVVFDGKRVEDLTESEASKSSRKRSVRLLSEDPSGEREVRKDVRETETVPASYLKSFARDKRVVSTEPLKETVDMTAKEHEDEGGGLRILQRNVGTKEEFSEISGRAEVPEDEYPEFAQGKTVSKRTEKHETVMLTDREFLEATKSGKTYRLLRKDVGTKTETETVRGSATVSAEEYQEFVRGKRVTKEERRTEKKLVDKYLEDSRRPMTQTVKVYQPGVWSHGKNHDEGSHAEFGATVTVRHVSGFSMFDPEFVDMADIREEIVRIIKEEHYNARYVRKRMDEKDGFNIERTYAA